MLGGPPGDSDAQLHQASDHWTALLPTAALALVMGLVAGGVPSPNLP